MTRNSSNTSGLSTIMVGYLLGVVSELEQRGIDADDLLSSAGLSNPLSNDPFNRCPTSLIADVFRLSVDATSDHHFGLHVTRSMKASDLHVLGLGLMISGSMLSFCQRLNRFMPMLCRNGNMRIVADHASYRVVTATPLSAAVEDSWQSLLYKLLCQVDSQALSPVRVEMQRSKPTSAIDVYEEHFSAPVSFGHRESALVFGKSDFEKPLRSGNEEFAHELDTRALAYLSKIQTNDILARVQNAIIECLEAQENTTIDAVQARARLSARQIRQYLNDQGTTFQRVLDNTRSYLAQNKLRNRKIPIMDVAYMTGFTDGANFTRAFKRWTGQTPHSYRESVLRQMH